MEKNLRILWVCAHETLRYEEVPMLIEAGAEVLPVIGDPTIIPFENHYEDECDEKYPRWREYCTLPSNITEKIRRINCWSTKGKITDEEAQLVNQYIDCIIVASFPDITANIFAWFQGILIYRIFGLGNNHTYSEWFKELGLEPTQFQGCDRFFWSPCLKSLAEKEAPELTSNEFFLNGFVSESRLQYKWAGRNSDLNFTTVFSYADSNLEVKQRCEEFLHLWLDSPVPLVALGKNSKEGVAEKYLRFFTGYLPQDEFFSRIANSRMFLYPGGNSYYHLHYTPLESIIIGVPTLFLEKSGIVSEARYNGISEQKLVESGMCRSNEEMHQRALTMCDDFAALNKLLRNQTELLLPLFSRDRALKYTREFYNKAAKLTNSLPQNRKNIILHNYPHLSDHLPKYVGQTKEFNGYALRGLTGKYIYSDGQPIGRLAAYGEDEVGFLVAALIKKIVPGSYRFSIIYEADEPDSLGVWGLGVWLQTYKELMSVPIGANAKKNSDGKIESSFIVNFRKKEAFAVKELRVYWYGLQDFMVYSIAVTKLSDSHKLPDIAVGNKGVKNVVQMIKKAFKMFASTIK